MKHIDQFANFLRDEVNLNKTRIENLESKAAAIEKFVLENWKVPVGEFEKQGSWAHRTIIKPPGNKGFDADLLAFVAPYESFEPTEYIDSLYAIFKASGIYESKVSRKTRCVTIEYANDFTLDVVPCVQKAGGYFGQDICNRRDNVFEPTDGKGFANWWHTRCSYANGDSLQEATRLLKYMRDIKLNFSVKSVLLTTLIGQQVSALDRALDVLCDVPTTLKVIIGRLDDYLQKQTTMPTIANPVLPDEFLTRNWDEEKYQNFRNKINKYRGWIDDAYAEPDEKESLLKWRDVFGDTFGADIVVEEARQVSARYMSNISTRIVGNAFQVGRALATDLLRTIPSNVPWMRRARWPMVRASTVLIRAGLYNSRNGPRDSNLESGQVVHRSKEILFEAVNSMGLPFPSSDFKVMWRVVNTDPDGVRSASELRGGFYKSDAGDGKHWETTQYRGVHWVEAFLIRKRDGVCCGQSERFFVVIE
ncbi:nucleotidyltransferase [Agrobacterium vitis]|uniref:Nucleotidyltransferase n=1 Tax=Agrobacterium vitis TaxID=373 RepID=A0A6L6VIS8_AGRVI|nr:nucleotidyltransferase [Agrobacterium vitis]MUZ73322.1 nucleotidyltransferase [Agrobacterium vitis]